MVKKNILFKVFFYIDKDFKKIIKILGRDIEILRIKIIVFFFFSKLDFKCYYMCIVCFNIFLKFRLYGRVF